MRMVWMLCREFRSDCLQDPRNVIWDPVPFKWFKAVESFRRINSLMGGSNLQISLVVLRRKHVDVGGLYDRPAVGPQVCNALLLVQGKDELGQLELQGRFKNRVKQCKAINFDPTKYHQVLVYYLYITYILLIYYLYIYITYIIMYIYIISRFI